MTTVVLVDPSLTRHTGDRSVEESRSKGRRHLTRIIVEGIFNDIFRYVILVIHVIVTRVFTSQSQSITIRKVLRLFYYDHPTPPHLSTITTTSVVRERKGHLPELVRCVRPGKYFT